MIYTIISDIHEDIISLKNIFIEIDLQKNTRTICLGDIVGFCLPYYESFLDTRSANDCISLIKNKCFGAVLGNHDLNSISKIPEKSIYNYPDNWYSLSSDIRLSLSNNTVHLYDDELPTLLNQKSKEYLKTLPEELIVDDIIFSHFLFPNITGSNRIYGDDLKIIKKHFQYMINQNCTVSFIGHLHKSGMRVISNKEVIDVKENEDLFLKSNEIYIILCPPIVGLNSNAPSYVKFDKEKMIVSWSSI